MILKNIHGRTVILIDVEFTCWEESLVTGWSDPLKPPEIIEIALVTYDATNQLEMESFTSLVKPRVNPVLSDYCLELLPILQTKIDMAPEFDEVMGSVEKFLSLHATDDSPTAGWGTIDRRFIALQSDRRGVDDPFSGRSHIPMDDLVKAFLNLDPTNPIEREDVRERLGIKTVKDRHRALADVRDLIAFDKALAGQVS